MRYQSNPNNILLIKEMAVNERPRERLEATSAESLSDLELLMILLGSGSKDYPVRAIAQKLLTLLDTKQELQREDIDKIQGIGMAKSCLISAALEIGRRKHKAVRKQIITPDDLYPLIRHYGEREQEHFIVSDLNGAHEVLSINVVSIGTVSKTIVHPREVFANAVGERASAIIVAHNHPSGTLQPSNEDIDITKRLKYAGEILGIPILDHLIITGESYISLLEQGRF